MARLETCILTNMCMIRNGSKVLVQNRKNPDWPGITFPGGHVEKGEPFTDAIIREVLEETGLTIHSPQLCGIKDWTNSDGTRYMVLFYKTTCFEGQLCSSEEGEVYWVELGEMASMELADDMLDMLKVFLDDNLSEFFYRRENGKWLSELK